MKQITKIILIITSLFILTGCGVQTINQDQEQTNEQNNNLQIKPYKLIELKDINTNQNYTLNDFEDKIVLIESFAVWCPTCTSQQKQIKKLHQLDKSIISISLNTDQNEDESQILEHTQKHGFDWRYTISPEELTSYFISNYGITFVSAPVVPILLKCPYSEPILLKNGLKSVEYLQTEIAKCEKKSNPNQKKEIETLTNTNPTDHTFDENQIKTLTDGTKYIIHPDKIQSGGVPKGKIGSEGGIPALDIENLNWITPTKANDWIQNNELILKLNYNGETRIYPFQILVFHEIVNDDFKGKPVIVTYCPLCGTGISYERIINQNNKQKIVKFGVSGKLFNSNLIMYDDLTDTYWQQIDGKAITGELTGQTLTPIETNTLTWKEFKESKDYNDNTKILSKNTGMERNYGNDPYGNYYNTTYLLFPPKNIDRRIDFKEIIYGIQINEEYKAYKHSDIVKFKEITDTIKNTQIQIKYENNGEVTFTNKNKNELIVKERGMWFSWYAFHPTTTLWEELK
jgi:thiol-disulfide isomerase/thioredoxin